MHHHHSNHLLLVVALASLLVAFTSADTFYIRLDKYTNCEYRGYAPGGAVRDPKKITAPVAKVTAGAMEAVLGGLTTASGLGAGTINTVNEFTKKFAKVAPKLGASLGLFGAAFGVLSEIGAPTMDDVLNSVNAAIGDLTEEMNQKLDAMKGYVDTQIINSERDMIRNQYRASFRFWTSCVKEYTEERATDCQFDAIKMLVSQRPQYSWFDSKLSKNEKLVGYERRRLEATLMLFRDYANLVIMELTPIIDQFCEDKSPRGAALCKRFSTELHDEVSFYIKYVEQAVEAIKDGHGARGACPSTVSCGPQHTIKEGGLFKVHTANWFECTCVIEDSNSKQFCKVHATMRKDGKHPHNYMRYNYNGYHGDTAGARRFGGLVFWHKAEDYQNVNRPVVKKYWDLNLLSMVPVWKKALKKAEFGMNLRASDEMEDIEEIEYSDDFETRLMRSGFKGATLM